MGLEIELEYYCAMRVPVDLPEGKTEEDILCHDVKWGLLTIVFTDGTEFETSVEGVPDIDWKRPTKSNIFEVDD